MKKLLTIFLCLVLSLSLAQSVYAAQTPDTSLEQDRVIEAFHELAQAQTRAVEAGEVFFKAFRNSESESYLEHFAGTYIQDNLLYIRFTALDQQDLTPYEAVLADYPDVVRFVEADYSLRTLEQARDFIWEEFQAMGIHVVSAGISNTQNAVSLGVTLETIHMLPAYVTLGEPSTHPTLQVPVIVSEEGIPTLLMEHAAAEADSTAPILPSYAPVFVFALFVLIAASFVLFRRKR